MASTKRGGAGRGQGRKPVRAGEETVTISLRVTSTQRAKLERLGGAKWVRDRIDRAKEPNDRVEGRDAALSRRVPSHDGLCGNGTEVGAGDTAKG